MENKCQNCGEYYKDSFGQCPLCNSPHNPLEVKSFPSSQSVQEEKCRYCAMMIPKEAKVCPYCRRNLGTSVFTAGVAVLAFFLLIGFFSTFSSNLGDGGSPSVSVGKKGTLQSGGELVPVAITDSDFKEWMKAIVAKDQQGQTLLISSGKIMLVKSGSGVLVIDTDWLERKVRILDGDHKGKSGWVLYEYVK